MDQLDERSAEPASELRLGAIDARSVRRFVAHFALLLALFCLPVLLIGAGYARAFCALGNALLPDAAEADRFAWHFDTSRDTLRPSEDQPWRVLLRVHDRTSHARVEMPIETLSVTYLPVVSFLALALATPIDDRKRELQILLPGFLSIVVIVLLLVALSVTVILNDRSPVHLVRQGSALARALSVLFDALLAPGMTYAIPLLLWWLLVSVTRPRAKP